MSRVEQFRGLKYRIMILLIGTILLRGLIELVHNNVSLESSDNIPSDTELIWLEKDQDSILVYRHGRSWQNNYGTPYQTKLTVRYDDVTQAIQSHRGLNPEGLTSFWGALYAQMAQESGPKLDLILDAFYQIYLQQPMSAELFAEMVVSCIQNIPYALVFQEACQEPENYQGWIEELLSECPDCCIGDQPFGLQSPLAFMQNLKGDCDTRTVFLFSVLSAFNYDVAILNSDVYLHSIIGLNLPSAGQYKLFQGKKYLVWETTAPNHLMGSLPPQIGNMNFWNVVLTHSPELN